MARDDLRTFQFDSTVEQVRYWVPQVADVARVVQSSGLGFWKIEIAPFTLNTCPVEVTLHCDEQFDAVLAGEAYPARTLPSHGFLVSLLESIAEGRVVQRRWRSSVSGAHKAIETLITLPDGTVWKGSSHFDQDASTWQHHDHHFLSYRRDR